MTNVEQKLQELGYHTSKAAGGLVVWLHGGYIARLNKRETSDTYRTLRHQCKLSEVNKIQQVLEVYND